MKKSQYGSIYRACKFCVRCCEDSRKLESYTTASEKLEAAEFRDKNTQRALKALDENERFLVNKESPNYNSSLGSDVKSWALKEQCLNCRNYESPAIRNYAVASALVIGDDGYAI